MQEQNVRVIALGDVPETLLDKETATLRDGDGDVYLARALSDEDYGTFSAFVDEGGLLLLYNRMGSCGTLIRRVIAIRLKARPSNAYAGCSAAF
jgi:hypothetical protein